VVVDVGVWFWKGGEDCVRCRGKCFHLETMVTIVYSGGRER